MTTGPPRVGTASGLVLHASDDPADSLLGDFYAGYDAAFVLEAEKEPLAGFVECMQLNRSAAGRRLAGRYGAFREIVVVARQGHDADAPLAGGANFSCFQFALAGQPVRTVALNYVYVLPRFRRRGYSREILLGCNELAARALDAIAGPAPGAATPLLFIEQHDPLRLHAGDAARDNHHAGIDQVDRLRVWSRCGAWIVDLDYVQPPLARGAEPAHDLLLSVCAGGAPELDACVLAAHLERFFAVACMKGRPLAEEPVAASQVDRLAADCRAQRRIRLLDALPWIERGAPRPAAAANSLRATLGALAP